MSLNYYLRDIFNLTAKMDIATLAKNNPILAYSQLEKVGLSLLLHPETLTKNKVRHYLKVDNVVVSVKTGPLNRMSTQEAFMGLQVANKLRQYVRNFSYTFCSTVDEQQVYIAKELIPGNSLDIYVKTCTKAQFRSVLLQLLYSLRFAYQEYRFVHNDLTCYNVIVHNHKSIPMQYDGNSINSDNTAFIIDYEEAEVGSTQHELLDIYTLIMQTALELDDSQSNPIVLKYISQLYGYFNNKFWSELKYYRGGGGFTPSVSKNQTQYSLDDFIKFVTSV